MTAREDATESLKASVEYADTSESQAAATRGVVSALLDLADAVREARAFAGVAMYGRREPLTREKLAEVEDAERRWAEARESSSPDPAHPPMTVKTYPIDPRESYAPSAPESPTLTWSFVDDEDAVPDVVEIRIDRRDGPPVRYRRVDEDDEHPVGKADV